MVRAWLILASLLGALTGAKAGEDLDTLAHRMADLLNAERAARGLKPLAWDDRLAKVALGHCRDMRDNGFFGHESERTGRVGDRVARARIPNRGVAENLARGTTIAVCHSALMASKPHRENILNPTFTHIGVGLVRSEDGRLLCTQVFMVAPPRPDVAAVTRRIVEEMNRQRLARGNRRLLPDAALAAIALEHSKRAAAAGKHDPHWLEQKMQDERKRWRVLEVGYFLTDSPEEVAGSRSAQGPSLTHFGLGVVVSPMESKTPGALWVTLICGLKK